MTVGASSADARPVLEVNGLLQLLIGVVAHFMAGDAERLGVHHLHRPVETTPKQQSANATGNEQGRQGKALNGAGDKGPDTRKETSLGGVWIAQGSTIP